MGRELLELSQNFKYWNFFKDNIPNDPEIAFQRISIVNGALPQGNGSNIDAFTKIRKRVSTYEGTTENYISYSLKIIAPHTHWEVGNPTIYSFSPEKNCYQVGPLSINSLSRYLPIAFSFTKNSLVAFEWLELVENEYVKDYKLLLPLLNSINRDGCFFNSSLGLGIDFRFKKSLFDPPKSTLESPLEGLEESISKIELSPYYTSTSKHQVTPVSWACSTDLSETLNSSEKILYEEMMSVLESMSEPEKIRFLLEKQKELDSSLTQL